MPPASSLAPRRSSASRLEEATSAPPIGLVGVGVVAPYDFALDRELWRWVPDDATLHLTRTPFCSLPVGLEQAETVGDPGVVARCTSDLVVVLPTVVAYACTSGSFVGGLLGERALVDAMMAAGAQAAVTTSGALLEALAGLGLDHIAVATPYDSTVTDALAAYLREADITVVKAACLGMTERIWTTPYAVSADLARAAAGAPGCEAVFISCTNLPTYDLIAPLECELGMPVLTANQVTMWSALRRAGLAAVATDHQLLLDDTDPGGWR